MAAKRREKALALLSGGLDSTVSLAMSFEAYEPACALFFDYGQHSALREEEAAERIASHYGIEFISLRIPWVEHFSDSRLISGKGEPPEENEESIGGTEWRSVWVENRNGIFVNIAALVAAHRGCRVVVTGFNREEAAAFPDNSREFVERINASLELGMRDKVHVVSPTIDMTKKEIASKGMELMVPWGDLWSCYRSGAVMCGRCESCLRLKRAIRGTKAEEMVGFLA